MAYNETTEIAGERIALSQTERDEVAKFHKSRIAFSILENGELAINIKDKREHRVYLEEDFGITREQFDKMTRGYIKPGRIVLYKTLHFLPIGELPKEALQKICKAAFDHFGSGLYEIWDGVRIGKPGEEWPPYEIKGSASILEGFALIDTSYE